MITVGRLTEFPDKRWNDFVLNTPQATCFHLSEWAALSKIVCGWEPHYLFAEENGTLQAVLPLVHVTRRMARGALVSTPFCVYGGAVAADDRCRKILENAAGELARDIDVAYLEVRQVTQTNPRWQSSDLYSSFKKPLLDDIDANFAAIPRKQRAMVRKGIRAELTATYGHDVATFYELFVLSMRNLGTRVYPRELISTLVSLFRDKLEISIIERQGRPLAGVLSLYFRDEVLPYYAGGVPDARIYAAFDFMYWDLMRHAVGNGVREFDFGRSMRGSGAFAFKKNWGFEPQQLRYQYDVIHGRGLPTMDPDKARFKVLAAIWRKLPVPVANMLGPVVSRRLY
ncbi:MAG: FemAB family PEP-CTERM system-associated protein [Proteobacteria bacterium]|nr:FemAB family PEP-CTERM system-associated protein [Pseudomonadota bacterium]